VGGDQLGAERQAVQAADRLRHRGHAGQVRRSR
jgi:hypothetical protein